MTRGHPELADPIALEYLAWCAQQGEPPNTIRRRRAVLRAVGSPGSITRDEMEAWWVSRSHLAKTSRGNELAILRTFYGWAEAFDRRIDNPTARLKRPRVSVGAPLPATTREFDRILAHLADLPKRGPQLRRAVLLGTWAGLRVSEAAGLGWSDIDVDLRRARVTGKGGKVRTVSLSRRLLDDLGDEHDGNVVTGHATSWSGNTLGKYVNAEIHAAVGPHVTFHKLRHRYGSLGYQRTKDPKALAEQMGHASVDTTMRFYAAAADEAAQQIADAVAGD